MFIVRIFSDKGLEILKRTGVKDYGRPNFLEGDVANVLCLDFEDTKDVIFFGDNFLVLVEELPDKK